MKIIIEFSDTPEPKTQNYDEKVPPMTQIICPYGTIEIPYGMAQIGAEYQDGVYALAHPLMAELCRVTGKQLTLRAVAAV